MTKYLDIYSDLIKLAAQMAKGEGVPDWSERVFSTGTPSYERRDMLSALRMADEAGITHALQLRAIADRLSAEMRSSNEPSEQRGPFAGLQSLSFDVSENPTIALVMRFDNIEHAQAARDQLWQPAGAFRDADHCDYPDCEHHWELVVDWALAAMKKLHESAEPDTDHPEIPAIIPAAAFRAFVDEHARLMRIRASAPQGASRDASPADLVGALQDVVHTDPGPVRAGKSVKSSEAYEKALKGRRREPNR